VNSVLSDQRRNSYLIPLGFGLLCTIIACQGWAEPPMSPDEAQKLLEKKDRRFLESSTTNKDNATSLEESTQQLPSSVVFDVESIEPPLADMLEFVLRKAVERGYDRVILRIDSDGGYVSEAERLAKLIRDYRDDIAIEAYVESAISAAIWPMLSCETIHARDGATLGGAQIYQQDRSTGNVLVDNKIVSISAAGVRSICERNGHPWDFVEPMVIAQPTGNQIQTTRTIWLDRYTAVRRTETVEEKTVATYTAEQALEKGLIKSISENIEATYEDRVSIAAAHIQAYFLSLYHSRYMETFFEVYDQETIADRWPRERITVNSRVKTGGGLISSYETRTKRRLQTEEERRRSGEAAGRKALGALKYAEKFEKELNEFLDSDHVYIFQVGDRKRRRIAERFIRTTLRRKAMVMNKTLEELEPAINNHHYGYIDDLLDRLDRRFRTDFSY